MKVSVIYVMKGEHMTHIPVRDAQITNLGDAVNTFIVCPKKLVLDTPQEAPRPSPDPKVLKLSIVCLLFAMLLIYVCSVDAFVIFRILTVKSTHFSRCCGRCNPKWAIVIFQYLLELSIH